MTTTFAEQIRWDKAQDITGTGRRAVLVPTTLSFQELRDRLALLSGQAITTFLDGKCGFYFVGTFEGEPFTLYDYNRDNLLHIGGRDALNIGGLTQYLRLIVQDKSE